MEINNLLDLYNNGKLNPALTEGKYEVKLISHEAVQKKDKTFIKFVFEDIHTGRKITENRFEKGFGIMLAHLREQLHMENQELVIKDFLNDLIKNETVINIWVTRVTFEDGSRKTNINFLEPIKKTAKAEPNTEVVDDTIIA